MALWLGTAGWSYKDWIGPFYPDGTTASAMLESYVQRFRAVEVDSSFYGIPAKRTVASWRRKAPIGFVFCPKFPKSISHDAFLVDCEEELLRFVEHMAGLEASLGPMLLQFPYFNKASGVDLQGFLDRLEPFLDLFAERAHPAMRIVVETRNKTFLKPALFEVLRARNVPLACIDHAWMPSPDQLQATKGLVTSDLLYIRMLGDRYGIEKITKTWEREVIDQNWRIASWADWIAQLLPDLEVFAFANNHFAGFAPASIERLRRELEAR
jgi:uncharacterized protein YecE (DUF72 family)